MVWNAEKSGRRGRPETFSDAAIQACLTFKVLFGLPLRQTVGLVESLIRMAGLDWPVPGFSTLCRRQARIAVQIPYRASRQPLNLLIPSRASLRNALPGSGQTAEIQIRTAIMNRFSALGRAEIVAVA